MAQPVPKVVHVWSYDLDNYRLVSNEESGDRFTLRLERSNRTDALGQPVWTPALDAYRPYSQINDLEPVVATLLDQVWRLAAGAK